MRIFFNKGPVTGDSVMSMDSGNLFFCPAYGRFYDDFGSGSGGRRYQPHVDGDRAVVRDHIGAVAAVDLPKGDGGSAEVVVVGCCLDALPYSGDHFCHGGNGVRPFPGRAGVGGYTVSGQFKPGAAFVGDLNLPVCGLGIQHPAIFSYPA